MGDLLHKKKPASNGRGPRSVCGQYGYVSPLWKRVNCPNCLKRKR